MKSSRLIAIVRPAAALFATSVILACSGFTDDGLDLGGGPVLTAFEPCIGMPGQFITIYGLNFEDAKHTTTVEFNGVRATTFTFFADRSGLSVKIPVGATTGPVTITNANGSTVSSEEFTVGFKQPVNEVEPTNNTTPGATPMGPMSQGKGILAVPSDKDHFKRECLIPGHRYKIKLTPRLVGTVYYGIGDPLTPLGLDLSGEAQIVASRNYVIVGLTGASGGYTLDINPVP